MVENKARMSLFRRLGVLACLLCIATCALLPLRARASNMRPNALDHRVDAISAVQLEAEPASRLVDPERQIAAQRLSRWTLPGWIASIAFQIIALAYFWQSGAAARLRDRFRRSAIGEMSVRFLFGASLALIARLAALLPGFYLFRVGRVMQLNGTLLRSWSATWLLNTLVAMAIAGVVVTAVLWLVDRTHQWYVFTIAAIVAGSFAITAMAGTVTFHRAALPYQIEKVARSLENRAGIHVPIEVRRRSGRSHIGDAAVLGMASTTRVIMDDTLVAGATPAELRFIVAREIGQVAAHDPIRSATINAALAIFGVALAVFIADRIGFRRDDDPVARLALVAALLGCMYFVVAPIDNAVLRSMSSAADRYAVALTGEREGALRFVVRGADQELDEICPNVVADVFLETSLPVGARVASLNGVPSGCP
ncbi:MAG: M48 family metalloprotease [Candidatus Eremiobacteraeota bacterium]|nr:M48 family metalloprotease [Candidatus Eremiobacteraeota bacterium]